MLVVETQTTTEDLLEGGTLAAEAGESAFAVSEEEHVAETAGNGLVYRFVKRAFDIAFSLCVVVVGLAPIALLLLIIRLESPGSPIYRQERIGYRGQPLRIFKLRTMVADSDDVEKHLSPEQLAQWRSERKVEDDPRVTRVGRFLRRTSLDELPQFLNVLACQQRGGTMMASIRFFKLFDMLARMGYKKTDLKTEIGLSSTTIAKLSKGESVTTDTILRICERFDVQPGDIMEYVPDEDQS